MIIHLATGQPVQLHIHTEDGDLPPLIVAAPPTAPAASYLSRFRRFDQRTTSAIQCQHRFAGD